jgi:uncharacterized membrane protein YfbV (UPF0208 family)
VRHRGSEPDESIGGANRVCNAAVSALKIVGCIAVVIGHCDTRFIACAMAAVAGFLSVSIAGVWSRSQKELVLRAIRTMNLFVVWTCLYLSFFVLINVVAGRSPFSRYIFTSSYFASGHLWYLPAMATLMLLLAVFGQRGRIRPSARVALLSAGLAVGAIYWLGEQSYTTIVATSLAGTMIWLAALPNRTDLGLVLGFGVVSVLMVVVEMLFDLPLRVMGILSITGCVVAAVRHRGSPAASLLCTASGWTGGVYLVHMMPVFVLRHYGLSGSLLMMASIAVSALIVAAVSVTPASAWFAVSRRSAGQARVVGQMTQVGS